MSLIRYPKAAARLAFDVAVWYRGGETSATSYRLMRRLHRATAGRSSSVARALARALPGSPDRRPSGTSLQPDGEQALAHLRRDGISMLEPVLDPEAMASFVDFARSAPATGWFPDGTRVNGTYLDLRHQASAVYLDGRFAWARPEVQRIMSDPSLWDLARAYFDMAPVVHPPTIYWSCAAADDAPTQAANLARNFHWDYDGIGGLRLHLYLTDVDESAAPMEYVLGSHRPGVLSTPELRRADDAETSERALDALGLIERKTMTGPAGTTFISDSNGLHRATRPTGRDRLFLVMPIRAGGYAGYYRRRRAVPVRDERFGTALAAGRPELRLFAPAPAHDRTVTLVGQT